MYLVTMEDDTGCWLEDPNVYDDRQEAYIAAARLANKWRRQAALYKCEFLTEIDPARNPEGLAEGVLRDAAQSVK